MTLVCFALAMASAPIRTIVNLNANWEYASQLNSEIRTVDQVPAGSWHSATLPHSPWMRRLDDKSIWQGVTFYRRELDVPPSLLRRRLILTLEGAMQVSEVWLNDVRVGGRQGGYLPVVVDLTGKMRPKNRLVVRLDNSDNPLVPPGKPQQQLDFMYGCGLYRNAYLTATGALYITDPILENLPASGGIYVTYPQVNQQRATVRVRTHVRNGQSTKASLVLEQKLVDIHGKVAALSVDPVGLAAGAAISKPVDLGVAHPHLWSPDSPYLYRLVTSIRAGDRVVDQVTTMVGIRSVSVSREKGFVLNGKPIRLIGTNRHQDYPWIGIALSDAAQLRDAILIKRAGHNIVRLSHYPQSPAFMDACDRLGIMTIPCIPGWQFNNKDPRFVDRVRQDIRELIRRDRNHPSAVFFETSLNETYPPAEIAKSWDRVAKEESLNGRVLTAGDAKTGASWDIAYNQWEEGFHRPQDAMPDRPGYIREYGDYEFGGGNSTSRVTLGAGMPSLMREAWNEAWSLNRYWPQYPWTMGYGTWVMFDHNVPWDFRVSACGLADLFRRPKPSFWFFASQFLFEPVLKVLPNGDGLVAFTNCDKVILKRGGSTLAEGVPERGVATEYEVTSPFDGSNTHSLPHPPIRFPGTSLSYSPIVAVGYRGGRPVIETSLASAREPVALKLSVDDQGVPLRGDGADVVFVRAALVDAGGTPVDWLNGQVRFQASGAGEIAGEQSTSLESGVASNLVRGLRRGAVSVRATLGRFSATMSLRAR